MSSRKPPWRRTNSIGDSSFTRSSARSATTWSSVWKTGRSGATTCLRVVASFGGRSNGPSVTPSFANYSSMRSPTSGTKAWRPLRLPVASIPRSSRRCTMARMPRIKPSWRFGVWRPSSGSCTRPCSTSLR